MVVLNSMALSSENGVTKTIRDRCPGRRENNSVRSTGQCGTKPRIKKLNEFSEWPNIEVKCDE